MQAERLEQIENKMICIRNMSSKVYFVWGRYDEAYKNFQDVLKYAQNIGNRRFQLVTLNDMGLILDNRGEYDEALRLYKESLEIARQLGHKEGISRTLYGIGNLLIDIESYIEALRYTLQSFKILERLQSGKVEDVIRNLNSIKVALGDKEYQKRVEEIEKTTPEL